MIPPKLIARLVLVASLISWLYLSEPVTSAGTDVAETPSVSVGQTEKGVSILFKPGFSNTRPSQAELDLIGALLPELL